MRKMPSGKMADERLNEQLTNSGFRFTPQRQQVYSVLMKTLDHPTAEQVFMRCKQAMPDISMATVYNCLDALVTSQLVRAVHVHREATRYCPNMNDHVHFYCDGCGGVFDIELGANGGKARFPLPVGFQASQYDVSIRGACPNCAGKKRK